MCVCLEWREIAMSRCKCTWIEKFAQFSGCTRRERRHTTAIAILAMITATPDGISPHLSYFPTRAIYNLNIRRRHTHMPCCTNTHKIRRRSFGKWCAFDVINARQPHTKIMPTRKIHDTLILHLENTQFSSRFECIIIIVFHFNSSERFCCSLSEVGNTANCVHAFVNVQIFATSKLNVFLMLLLLLILEIRVLQLPLTRYIKNYLILSSHLELCLSKLASSCSLSLFSFELVWCHFLLSNNSPFSDTRGGRAYNTKSHDQVKSSLKCCCDDTFCVYLCVHVLYERVEDVRSVGNRGLTDRCECLEP